MRSPKVAAVLLSLLAFPLTSEAIAIVGGEAVELVGDGTLADFEAYLNYHASSSTSATLEVTLVNTTSATIGGYLTGYVFNNPSSLISSVSLNDPLFSLVGDRDYDEGVRTDGQMFDVGAATGSTFLSNNDQTDGLQPGQSRLFSFGLTGTMLDTLNVNSFISELASNDTCCDYFLARFTSLDDGSNNGTTAIVAARVVAPPAATPTPGATEDAQPLVADSMPAPDADQPPAPEGAQAPAEGSAPEGEVDLGLAKAPSSDPPASPTEPAPPDSPGSPVSPPPPNPPISFIEPPPPPSPPPGGGAPEPSTLIFLASAVVALARYGRRRTS